MVLCCGVSQLAIWWRHSSAIIPGFLVIWFGLCQIYVYLVVGNVPARHLVAPFLIWRFREDSLGWFVSFWRVIFLWEYCEFWGIVMDVKIGSYFNCFWELIWVILALVRLGNEELGTAIFGTSLFGFVCGSCLWNLIESVCMSHWWLCHSAVSTQFIFSSFGSFWSLLLGSSMARKWPRPAEVLSCVVING